MKKILPAFLCFFLFIGCSKNSDAPVDGSGNPPPISNPPGPEDVQLTSASMLYGFTNDIITLTGKNFGSDIAALSVKINNVAAVIVTNSLSNAVSCKIKVPAKCGSGVISLTRNGKTASLPGFYYMQSVNVTTMFGKYTTHAIVNGTGTDMGLLAPSDFVVDKSNNLYVVDNHKLVRKINAAGTIATYSGGPQNGTTSNDNLLWTISLPAAGNVNGGLARFNFIGGISISEDPNSTAFKLFVTDGRFIRVINEASATGVFAGNLADSTGGNRPPFTGGRYEAHLDPFQAAVVVPNGNDYGSPTLYFLNLSPKRLVKQDVNGNISTALDLSALTKPAYLTRSTDGFMYMFDNDFTLYKIAGNGSSMSKWINITDSLLNRATGLKEQFGNQLPGYPTSMTADKDGNLLIWKYTSDRTALYKIFPDKSFIRAYEFLHIGVYTGADGINGQAQVFEPSKMIVRPNGDIWFTDDFTIRKMSFE